MPDFTPDRWAAVCSTLELDPATTESIAASPLWLRVTHSDQPATFFPMVATPVQPDAE